MLKELYIENLAVIKKATITFNNNLNVFTGETGAGKSILINGINAVLGQRTTKDIVRSGCDKAVVSALFVSITKSTKDKLNDSGITYDNDEIIVSREIFADGGSVARINSRPVTVSILKEIGESLINIHGQHDSQILLKSEKHIEILDSFGEIEIALADYQNCFKMLQETAREINKLTINENEKAYRLSELNDKITEIEALDIDEEEDSLIEDEYLISKNSVKLFEGLNNAYNFLSGNDDFDGSIVITDNAAEQINYIKELMPQLDDITQRLKAASIEIDDIAAEISHIISKTNISPERFDYISNRREQINKIKRKYGPELSDVLTNYNIFVAEKEHLEDNDNEIEILKVKKAELLNDVTIKAKALSKLREEASEKFINKVTDELTFLDMPNVKLAVSHEKGKLTINGMDNIELLISSNIGEPPKPISKIASGGELSRIMLALKNVLADKDDIPTLIFDEIDTGVSGRAAQKIGIKLSQISKNRQVLCVTHLAQIAVMADTHLYIEKNVVDNSTVTKVNELSFDERKSEIARIMGGTNINETMLKSAEELLLSAKK